MIVTIVRFPASARGTNPTTVEEARELFGTSASTYLDTPGLLWKAYLRSEDGTKLGGVYWWRDRSSAEAKYNDGWILGVTKKYGAPPVIEWFDAPVVVDIATQTIRVEAPPLPPDPAAEILD